MNKKEHNNFMESNTSKSIIPNIHRAIELF
jgi:hypothetical protein